MRNALVCAACVSSIGVLALLNAAVPVQATRVPAEQGKPGAPAFQVDPLWPKPLPNHWLFGSITGVAIDAQDRIWVVHRGADSLNARTEMSAATKPPTAESCCVSAPSVMAFDQSGALVANWGGPGTGYDWPRSPGGRTIDAKGNVWIAAAGVTETPPARGRGNTEAPAGPPAKADSHVLKFSPDGKFLLQIGEAGKPGANDSKTALNRP